MSKIMERLMVAILPDKLLAAFGLLFEAPPRESIEKGDKLPLGPPLFLRIVVICEASLVIALFIYLAYKSLSASVIQSEIVGQLKTGSEYSCTVLSPLNTMKPLDQDISESAHYSTALASSNECIGNLSTITQNCNVHLLDFNILSAYGYDTSKILCYAFFKNGDALCQASYTDFANGNTLYASVPYSPSRTIQRSFPNYADFPRRPSGTFLRSFVNGTISDVTFDLTTSVSASYLLGTGFAPVVDPDGECIYYATSSTELSSSTVAWRLWQYCQAKRQSDPYLVLTVAGSSESVYPAIDQICGLAASKTQLWFAMKMFLNGASSPSVAVFGSIDLVTKKIAPINAEAVPELSFLCSTLMRSIAVSDDNVAYLLTKSGLLVGFPATNFFNGNDPNTFLTKSDCPSGSSACKANMVVHPYLYIQNPYTQEWLPLDYYQKVMTIIPISSFVVVSNYTYIAFYTSVTNSVVIFGGSLTNFVHYSAVYATSNTTTLTYTTGQTLVQGVNFFVKGSQISPAQFGIPLVPLQALENYPGFYNIFTNSISYSALLINGWQKGILYVMYSGQSLRIDTAKFGQPIPSDPWANVNYTYVWKNVSVGWRVGICNKMLVNTTEISPGYGVPPYFGDLCSGINGYFLQSSYVTNVVSACRTSTVNELIHCPALRSEFKKQAVGTCQRLIKQACVASYELNPPYICSKSVPADPYTAIGSAIGSAQAMFTFVCVFVTFLLHRLLCRKYTNARYLDRVREIETQEIRINKRFVLFDSKQHHNTSAANGGNGLKDALHRNMMQEQENGTNPMDGRVSAGLHSTPAPDGTHSSFDRKIYPGSDNDSYTNP